MINHKKVLIENNEVVEFSKKDNTYKQIFMLVDTVNDNMRYYPKQQYLNNEPQLKKKIENRRLLGELEHPFTDDINRIYTVNLKEVQILITDLKLHDKTVYGEFQILNTPNGVILKNLLDYNINLGISLRGLGDTEEKIIENKQVEYIIPDSFEIICWDIVHTPGFSDQMILTESVKYLKRMESRGKLNRFEEYVLTEFIKRIKK